MTTDTLTLDRHELEEHLNGANPGTLLASLVTLTADCKRYERLAKALTYRSGAAGITSILPKQEWSELRAWALEVLTQPMAQAADTTDLSDDLFARLCSTLVGFEVAETSAPFLRAQGGFTPFVENVPRTRKAPSGFKIAIIGAGMSGIAMAVAAQHRGIDYMILERGDDVGGVWQQNTYPGVGVDTPSAFYSFSFEINPDWTHPFPEGDQYLRYLARIADKYAVRERVRFGAEVEALEWEGGQSRWAITYSTSEGRVTTHANAVVSAAGYLTCPQFPDVDGMATFTGDSWHSSQWRHDVDLTGRRVAVVGTGCTSVQVVDAIADQAANITVFQRQPHWVVPSAGKEGYSEAHRWLTNNIPSYAQWVRLLAFLPSSDVNYEVSRYDETWASEHDLSISRTNDELLQVCLAYLNETFDDRPDLKAQLTPSFAPWGKRIIRDPGRYFDTLKKESTALATAGIKQIVPDGIIDGNGVLHDVDVIVYATGFNLNYLSQWTIKGADGTDLGEVWRDRPVAYNGCLVPKFPNLFITSGPNASPGHGAGHTFMVETVVQYITESLQTLFDKNAASIEVTERAHSKWRDEIDTALADSVWVRETGATTYYRNAAGDVVLANPFRFEDSWARLRRPNLDDVVLH
ncbi:flavin-containing monooxygenase [Rhodococcus triatomae]